MSREGYDVSIVRDGEGKAGALAFSSPAASDAPGCRLRLRCANPECAREFEARAQVGNRAAPKCCSADCRNQLRIARLVEARLEAERQAALPLIDEPCPALSHDAEVRAMVLAVLADGKEHEPSDFCRASGLTWARINPRLRDLRKAPFGGFNIPSRLREIRGDGTKVYVYRLLGRPAA